jgi:hypothetical protein
MMDTQQMSTDLFHLIKSWIAKDADSAQIAVVLSGYLIESSREMTEEQFMTAISGHYSFRNKKNDSK